MIERQIYNSVAQSEVVESRSLQPKQLNLMVKSAAKKCGSDCCHAYSRVVLSERSFFRSGG